MINYGNQGADKKMHIISAVDKFAHVVMLRTTHRSREKEL